MLFKGNSSKLELLIEKIQANKENGPDSETGSVANEEVSVGGSSWDVGSDGRGSLSPASSATPTSASETDVEAAATVGVTQTTPYQCSFCDRAFPRLSYLKRHEQLHGFKTENWPTVTACSVLHVPPASTAFSSPCFLSLSKKFDQSQEEKWKRDSLVRELKYESGKHYVNDAKIKENGSENECVKFNRNIDKENASNKGTSNKSKIFDFHRVKRRKGSNCGTLERNESVQLMAKRPSKYRKIVSKKKVSETTNGSQTLISEKSIFEPLMHKSVPLFSADFSRSNPGQCQGKAGNLLTQRCHKIYYSEKDLQGSRWLPRGKEFVEEVLEMRHGLENDRLLESKSFTEKLSRDEELCTTVNRSEKTISNVYLKVLNSENVYAEETVKKSSQQKTRDNYENRSCVNVWTQDKVFAYVEKELKNLRENHAPVNISNRISEEVFQFIEMELRRLDAEASLNSTPLTQGKISDYRELLKTPEDKVSSLSWAYKDTKQSCSDCGSDAKCSKFRHCISSSSDEDSLGVRGILNAKGLCSTTYRDLTEPNVLEGKDNICINENVLCLRHLDQLPSNLINCNTSSMKRPINSFPYYPAKFEKCLDKHNGCESQASQGTIGCFSNMLPSSKDNYTVEETQENVSFDKICSKKVDRRTNNLRLGLHRNKRMKQERTFKGKKSKKENKHAYKMSKRKRVKQSLPANAWNSRHCRIGYYNAHGPLSRRESEIKPFATGRDYLLHGITVPSRSRNIAKFEMFSKETCDSQFNNGKKLKSNQASVSTEAKYSAPCQSKASLAIFDRSLLPEIPDYNWPASRFIHSHESGSSFINNSTRDKQIWRKSNNNYNVETFKVEEVGPYLFYVNPNSYSTSGLLPICTWMPSLFESRNSFLKNESCDQICKPVQQTLTPTPWPEILSSSLPSSGINAVEIVDSLVSHDPSPRFLSPSAQICSKACPISTKHSNACKSGYENIISNYMLSMRCKYLPDCNSCREGLTTRLYLEDIPTKDVTNDCGNNEDFKCVTKVASSTTKNAKRQNLKIKSTAFKSSNKFKIVKDDCMQEKSLQTCGAQMVTKVIDLSLASTKPISFHIKVRTGGNAGQTGESLGLSSKLDNEHAEKKNTTRVIQVRTHPLAEEYQFEVCGPEISGQRSFESLYEHGKNICTNIEGKSFEDSFSLKSKCGELSPRQICYKYKRPSFSLDHSCGSVAKDKIDNGNRVSCCQEEHVADNSITECTLENTNYIAIPNEQDRNITLDKTNGLVLASQHRNFIQSIKTEAEDDNWDKTSGTDDAMTLSSVVVKEASKWKFQRYHPYILPKKRQLGMFRIAKIHQINGNEVNKIINISKEYNCVSANEMVNNLDNLFESQSVSTDENCHCKNLHVSCTKAMGFGSEREPSSASLPQLLEYCKVGNNAISKTFKDGEIGFKTNSESESENRGNINTLQQISDISKSSTSLVAENSASLKGLLITTRSNTTTVLSNSYFKARPSDTDFNISQEANLSDLQEFDESSVNSQVFQRKSNTVKDEHCWLEKLSKTGNISINMNGDDNISTRMEISGLQSDQHKHEPLLPLESIWSGSHPSKLESKLIGKPSSPFLGSSQSLSASRLIDKTVSPSSVVRQGAHFQLIHKIAPCVLQPNQSKVVSQADSCTLHKAKKRKRVIVLNKNNKNKHKFEYDVCTKLPSSTVLKSDSNNNAVSVSCKSDDSSFSNCSPFKTFAFKHFQGISDVSSSDEEPVMSHNYLDDISSSNVDSKDNIDLDANATWLRPTHDSVLVHGANKTDANLSVSPSLTFPSSSRNALTSSDPKQFVTATENNVEARLGSKESTHSKVLHDKMDRSQADNNVLSEKVDVLDETYFSGIQNNEDLFPDFEKEFVNLYGETNWKSVENLARNSPNNFDTVFMDRHVMSEGVNSFNSCLPQLPLNESTRNTPHKNSAFNCKLFAPQEHKEVGKLEETDLSNHLNFIEEESEKNSSSSNKIVLHNSETSALDISPVNNSTRSKNIHCVMENSMTKEESKLKEREPLLNKLHSENIWNPTNFKLPKLGLSPEKDKFESPPSGKDRPTEEQDILDLALRTDLYDVITLGNGTMYSWPQIEEFTESTASQQTAQNPDKDLVNCEKRTKLPYQEQTNGVSTQDSRLILGRSTVGLVKLGIMDSCAKNAETMFFLANSNSSKLLNTFDNAHSSCAIEDDTDVLKEDSDVLKEKGKNSSTSSFYQLTHADQLPFRCEFCGRLFKHKRSRDRHVKLHTGDKKYKCCHCEAAFSRSDHLKIHKKTHDTQKPYQCSVCNRGYNTAAALTAHMQNHKAKLTAHALNQLLKDAQAPGEAHVLSQLLRDSSGDAHSHSLNHLLKDTQKEQLLSPKRLELGAGSSPGDLTASPVGEPSPTLSPVTTVRCPICHAHCRNPAHLQRHLSRYHVDEIHTVSAERPASRGGGSGASSIGGASSAASTPSPRPPSSLPSPRPLPNPLLSLVGGKLACIYCSRDGFPSVEALQLHLQSAHGSALNGEVRDMAAMLGLPSSLGTSLGASGLATSLASPLGPGSSRGVSCELCGARVGGVTALQRHVVTAHTFTDLLARAAEGVFCAQCLLPFSNPGALAEHIKLVHTAPALSAVLNKRPPSPPSDKPTDLSKKSRHENLTSDLPASTLLCSQCNAPFTNFEAFRRHLKSHLDGGEQLSSTMAGAVQLACPECRLPLTSETALEAHLATHLGITSTEYGCQACLKLFSKPDELQKHLMDIHAHHLYRCALCKEMFDSKVSIQVHFAVKHSNECKVNKCTRCSLVFRSQSEFERHIRASHMRRGQSGGETLTGSGSVGGSGGSYRCLLCTLTLSSEAELGAHVATHQRQFQCSLCDDAFYVEFLLDKHMQTQHNSELNGNIPQPENLAKPRRSPQKKDLRCDICDAEFSTDSGLLNHRKQAHNIKSGSGGMAAKVAAASLSLFCAYCSEACKSRGDLEAHMKSHQGNGGRHKCNICDELCPSAALLAQHKLTHVKVVSGSACAVCREPLTSEQQFTSHQNEHHQSPLPQPCVVCRQTLVTDMEVTVHARFHAAQAAQAAAAASIASGIFSSGELLPPSSNSSLITTAATVSTITTNSNGSSRSSSSPRHSPSLRCSECHIKLETIEEAEAHAAAHHNHHHQKPQPQQQGFGRSLTSSSRTYQCIKCQESFASEAEIEAHVASHLLHEGSVHECHLCRATFDTPLRLQCHLIEHTFEGCGSFTCYMCSSVFTTASRLQQHMVEHGLSARPYDCHHCHQRFFFRAELENHALSHPEAADGGCRECLASFPDLPRRSLRRPSLSCMTSAQHVGAHMTQTRANCDMGPQRPASPYTGCTGDETDAGPANGHATSVTDVKDE